MKRVTSVSSRDDLFQPASISYPQGFEPRKGFESRTCSLREAARALGISDSLAYKLAREGQFPARVLRIGQRRCSPRKS